jgi:hypothetical protein
MPCLAKAADPRNDPPLSKHGPVWRSFFDPLYTSGYVFILPVLTGMVFAAVMGVTGGWLGVPIGMLIGLSLEIPLAGRALLVGWVTRKKNRGS